MVRDFTLGGFLDPSSLICSSFFMSVGEDGQRFLLFFMMLGFAEVVGHFQLGRNLYTIAYFVIQKVLHHHQSIVYQ